MKKIMLTLIVLLLAAAPAMANSTFNGSATPDLLLADSVDPTQGEGDGGVQILAASNNVYGDVIASANRFSAITLHLNGTYEYATSSENTKIFRNLRTETNIGTATFDTTLATSDTTEFDGWSAL